MSRIRAHQWVNTATLGIVLALLATDMLAIGAGIVIAAVALYQAGRELRAVDDDDEGVEAEGEAEPATA